MSHIKACSFSKNFDIIAISETRITKDMSEISSISLYNCAIESTPTESSVGGILMYVANHLAHKPRTDLQIYKNVTWNQLLLR